MGMGIPAPYKTWAVMKYIVHGPIGAIHLLFSILSMITGLLVLLLKKGTTRHKRLGYLYAVSMFIVNLTACMIYRLYGRFGIFHWMAVMSCAVLFTGLYPVIRKKGNNYLLIHFTCMYWSVIGLYSAFMAELFTRLPAIILTTAGRPMTVFYQLAGMGIALVMLLGLYFFLKYRQQWAKLYARQ